MPLSEHEQKLLAQMEQALYAEDPKFATTLTGRARGIGSVFRASVGLGSVVIGLGLIIVGITVEQIWLSVIGFVVMFAGIVFAVAAPGASTDRAKGKNKGKGKQGPAGRRRTPPGRSSFVQRMEQRWEKRAEGGGFD